MMPTIQELREKARREQERKRRDSGSRQQESFRNDGFFESTSYTNWDSGNDSGSSGSDSGSSGCD